MKQYDKQARLSGSFILQPPSEFRIPSEFQVLSEVFLRSPDLKHLFAVCEESKTVSSDCSEIDIRTAGIRFSDTLRMRDKWNDVWGAMGSRSTALGELNQ